MRNDRYIFFRKLRSLYTPCVTLFRRFHFFNDPLDSEWFVNLKVSKRFDSSVSCMAERPPGSDPPRTLAPSVFSEPYELYVPPPEHTTRSVGFSHGKKPPNHNPLSHYGRLGIIYKTQPCADQLSQILLILCSNNTRLKEAYYAS